MHRFSWVALVAFASLLVVACGDDSSVDIDTGTGGALLGAGGSGGDVVGHGGSPGSGGAPGTGGEPGTGGTPGGGGDGGSGPACGDGVANEGEDCDGADLRGSSCIAFDFDGGELRCNPDCTWDTSACFLVEICDDGIDNDGDGDTDCDDSDCFDDIAHCPRCGDGVTNGDDACDGEAIPTTCEAEGYSHGTVGCTDTCQLDFSGCFEFEVCDDGIDNDGDGAIDCADADCLDDIEACPRCGDGVINGSDVCDGDAIATTCADEGFSHGTLGCTDSCKLDYAGCIPFEFCGDGIDNDLDGDTDCDDADCLGHFDCPACGDGILQRGEECEDGVPLTATCSTFGFNSGDLGCAGCYYDLTACHNVENCSNGIDDTGNGLVDCEDPQCEGTVHCPVCGNGVVETGEQCDDGNTLPNDGCSDTCTFEGTTCANAIDLNLYAGTLPDTWVLQDATTGRPDSYDATCFSTSPSSDMFVGFTAPVQGIYRAIFDIQTDAILTVMDSTCSELSCNDNNWNLGGETITIELGANEQVFFVLDSYAGVSPTDGPFTLTVDRIATTEVEPNDSFATATPHTTPATGAALDEFDLDFWSFPVTAGTSYTVFTSGLADGTCGGIDTYLTIHDAAQSFLDSNDDVDYLAGDWCSKVSFTASTTGTYYAQVEAPYSPVGFYYLWVDLQ